MDNGHNTSTKTLQTNRDAPNSKCGNMCTQGSPKHEKHGKPCWIKSYHFDIEPQPMPTVSKQHMHLQLKTYKPWGFNITCRFLQGPLTKLNWLILLAPLAPKDFLMIES